MSKHKILIALSGGVDSTVAASLLMDDSCDVVGITMRMRDFARSDESIEAARDAASILGIEHHVVDLKGEFEDLVLRPFAEQYARGRTPNPCVVCNPKVKFDLLMKRMDAFGCDGFATGHYARTQKIGEKYLLLKGRDLRKDQSYFLAMLDQKQLGRVRFPLGDLKKDQVRRLAAEKNLPAASRKESQDICFCPDGDYVPLVENLLGNKIPGPGDIVDLKGEILGRHQGHHKLTIGQRKGLGSLGPKPKYIVGIEADTGRVIVGDNDDLFSSALRCNHFHWISGHPPEGEIKGILRIRYKHEGRSAAAQSGGEGVIFTFDEPVRAVTPGQAAVFYQDDVVLGGGWIDEAL